MGPGQIRTAGIVATEQAKDPSYLSGPSVRDVRRSYVGEQYPAMVRNGRLRNRDLRRLRDEASTFEHRPLVSVLVPLRKPERRWLERTLDSVVGQVYPGWELRVCVDGSADKRAEDLLSRYERLDERIAVRRLEHDASMVELSNATLSTAGGEYVCLMGQDGDELAPDALFEIVKLLQEHPGADLLYTDEDTMEEEGRRSAPRFKPDWSPELMLSTNYIASSGVYRRSLAEDLGGFREEFEGCQDYDLLLRLTEQTDHVLHVPKVLYHRRKAAGRSGDDVREKSRHALSEALERRGLGGSVEDGILPGTFRARPRLEGEPLVSIIIPTRDNVSMLKNCMESIERLTTYRNYEILIVDNDSADPETVEYLGSVPHRVVTFREAFNYSRINNFAVSHARGEYVLLLNDDTEVIEGGWLEAMLEHAQRPEIGAVGARLLYPDGRVQHAGVLTGTGTLGAGISTHAYQFYSAEDAGHLGTLAAATNYNAVTAACMMMRKGDYEEVGGLDEENLPVSFNDVDLCLRIRERGYLVVYTPHAELYHHESASRGRKDRSSESLYMRERWGEVLDGDPYYNPNFSRGRGDFNLRADMLRPRILRPTPSSVNPSISTLSMDPIERRNAIKAYQMAARDSYRTTIVPWRERESMRVAALESSGQREDHRSNGQPESASPEPPRARSDKETGKRALVRAEQLVWMFGSPRTGSTWLSKIMAELEDQERWNEPYVGLLFGWFIYDRLAGAEKLSSSSQFIMGEPHREAWLSSIGRFVLEGATVRYPDLREHQHLVVKEPNGSLGAPILTQALPESRVIFLIRDPRDVVASRLEAVDEGGWTGQNRTLDSPEKLTAFTRHLAEDYLRVISRVEEAYEAHPLGKKALVRYEDVRADTLAAMEQMYSSLRMTVDREALARAVEKHDWERVPENKKGEGKFFRKASPGSWQEDLTAEQIAVVEEVTGSVLARYYPQSATGKALPTGDHRHREEN